MLMKITAYQTKRVNIGDSLVTLLDDHLPVLTENTIVVITSKIISLCENRVVAKLATAEHQKQQLIQQEADAILEKNHSKHSQHQNIYLTIKNNILIPSAGIDESNGDEVYILYPEAIQTSAEYIWDYLRKKHHIQHLGILITDSHTTPLRRGVTGICLAWCGFKALYSYIGQPDCFGHLLKMTQTNNLDALASSAVYVMGEGNEQTPLAIISDIPRIVFQHRRPSRAEINEITIPIEQDIYAPLLTATSWIWRK